MMSHKNPILNFAATFNFEFWQGAAVAQNCIHWFNLKWGKIRIENYKKKYFKKSNVFNRSGDLHYTDLMTFAAVK